MKQCVTRAYWPKETGNEIESNMAEYMAVQINIISVGTYFDAEALTKRRFVISVEFWKVFPFVWLDFGEKEIAAWLQNTETETTFTNVDQQAGYSQLLPEVK